MEDDFFNDTPSYPQSTPVYQPPPLQDDFGHFENSSPQYLNTLNQQQNSQPDIGQEYDALTRIRRQEDELNQKLRNKAEQEYLLKKQRKQNGQKQLNDFLSQRQKNIESKRNTNRQEQNLNAQKIKNYKSPWEKVADNINLKPNEQPGKKDAQRMRQAILNKKQDDLRS